LSNILLRVKSLRPTRQHLFAKAVLVGMIVVLALIINAAVDIVKIPLLNPSDDKNILPLGISWWLGNETEIPDVEIDMSLNYTGTLVAGKPVLLSAFGYVANPNGEDISFVEVGITLSLAFPPSNDNRSRPQDGPLTINRVNGTDELAFNSTMIYFPTEGDYSPIVIPVYYNHIGYHYPLSYAPIHVLPESELTAEKYSRINLILTYAIIVFAFFEAFHLYLEHRKD